LTINTAKGRYVLIFFGQSYTPTTDMSEQARAKFKPLTSFYFFSRLYSRRPGWLFHTNDVELIRWWASYHCR